MNETARLAARVASADFAGITAPAREVTKQALMDFIGEIEKNLGKKGKIKFKPMQPGDVQATYANVESLYHYINFKPETSMKEGVRAFVEKYLEMN